MLYIGSHEVVEAIGEGVVRRALALALMDATLAIVLRRRNLSGNQAADVVGHALSFNGRPYDKIGAVGSGTTMGRGAVLAQVGCRLSLLACGGTAALIAMNASESQRDESFFCSELVSRAFELAGVPIVDGPASFASPRTVRVSRHLYYMGRLL
jgi:uncharacterized protein YycO